MFGLKIFVRVQTFRRGPPVLPRNFCHPDDEQDLYDYGFVDISDTQVAMKCNDV